MQNPEVTKETVKALAAANGVDIPDERLDAVFKQYLDYMKILARMDSLPLAREAEPEITYTLKKK